MKLQIAWVSAWTVYILAANPWPVNALLILAAVLMGIAWYWIKVLWRRRKLSRRTYRGREVS